MNISKEELQKRIDEFQSELDSLSSLEFHAPIKEWENKKNQRRAYHLVKWLNDLRNQIKKFN